MKKLISLLFVLILLFCGSTAGADRQVVEKDQFYIGAMRVVRCNSYVSLREAPNKTSKQLAKIEPDEIVYYCSPAPEYEPVETRSESKKMTREEIIGSGNIVFEWTEFNVSVLAAYEVITEKEGELPWETLRVGCFIDDEPEWGYIEQVQQSGQFKNLTAFIGGTEDEPQVYVYDAEYGLIMLDLIDGSEQWVLSKDACSLGDCAVVTAGANTGILYVAGSDGPDPVAISAEGNVLWRSVIDDPEIYGPTEIILNPNDIEIHYECGKSVKLEYNGELISISDL